MSLPRAKTWRAISYEWEIDLRRLLLATIVVAACVAQAQAQPTLTAKDAWVRGTVAGQTATGAFMSLQSGADSVLIGAESPIAGIVEIHESSMVNNVMRMREVPRLSLPAGKSVVLKPGGYHIMMMDLKQPLKVGEAVPIRLQVEARDKTVHSVEVTATVRALGAEAPNQRH